jgi:hypothetical protein
MTRIELCQVKPTLYWQCILPARQSRPAQNLQTKPRRSPLRGVLLARDDGCKSENRGSYGFLVTVLLLHLISAIDLELEKPDSLRSSAHCPQSCDQTEDSLAQQCWWKLCTQKQESEEPCVYLCAAVLRKRVSLVASDIRDSITKTPGMCSIKRGI